MPDCCTSKGSGLLERYLPFEWMTAEPTAQVADKIRLHSEKVIKHFFSSVYIEGVCLSITRKTVYIIFLFLYKIQNLTLLYLLCFFRVAR